METDNKTSGKKKSQQHPEDAEKHNAQQEREYRKQKDGTMKKSPEDTPDEKATEKYTDLKSENKRKNGEEE